MGLVALVVSVSYIGTVDSDNRVATLAAVSTGGSLNTTPSGSGSLQTNIPLGNLNTKLTDSCKTPGVGCAFRSGNIYPDGDCNPVKTAAALNGCKKQYGIARLQVTSGVGVPAPSIVGIKYTSTKCTVTVRLRKTGPVITGPCKTDANKTCPTAHANDKTACFWQGCPGTCLKPS